MHDSYRHKKRRGYRRHRDYDSHEDTLSISLDESLYRENYSAASILRNKILSENSLSSHTFPPCKFREQVTYEIRQRVKKTEARAYNPDCYHCSIKNEHYYTISQSTTVFMCLDYYKNCILEEQILLLPLKHIASTVNLDENGYIELRNYQKTLVNMFDKVDKVVIFAEVSLNNKRLKGIGTDNHVDHCKIECYPIPKELLNEAKCYFIKALEEVGSYSSQNQKVIDIRGKVGVRGHIPQGIDFIHIDFSLGGEGMACVIDDQVRIKPTFARDIISGILEFDALQRVFRDREDYTKAIESVRKRYKTYDWTRVV
ncbi:hypothetical protein BEWA_021510 [Theileria equi strain WA]|uniref:Cwf19-like C-terminal domain-containing protein n=1 Tax=Theileria equi strain WA TaxID=1537102 RepID=L0AVN2_THEEQ|nr:hypothetical protein BEWA_021510 [Theileria equi strain WA]AFZ79303.1 hypothetical protein BEWA_021510 [Theileria equi strain WA]|eukprot:XP_004828969.1 hypothetical protein BEWA_021510 [Theileria equi strain WA]